MSDLTDAELIDLARLHGMYTGMLNEEELALFEKAIRCGKAFRSWKSNSAILGISKVHIV